MVDKEQARDSTVKVIFSLAVLLNAALIFWVELFFAKRLLPSLGGSPAVWNTSLMFYQVVIVAGYGYVLLIDRLPLRRQFALHSGLVLLAIAYLPWSLFFWSGAPIEAPILWLLGLLALSLGPLFFVLATGAPLLQRWFSHTGHRESADPYFLYAASNAGSFLALAAFPLLIEPLISLEGQAAAWKASFLGTGCLILLAGALTLRRGGGRQAAVERVEGEERAGVPGVEGQEREDGEGREDLEGPPGIPLGTILHPVEPFASADAAESVGGVASKRRWRWILLAFVPSSLLLGVTTHITSEIAPVPLLWVVPLGLYLVTFIVAFGTRLGGAIADPAGETLRGGAIADGAGNTLRRGAIAGGAPSPSGASILRIGLTVLLLGLAGMLLWTLRGEAGWLLILGDLAILTAAGLFCHGRLARDRPVPAHLAEFYLWIAVGGALGGVFNTLLAPILFEDPLEYPLVLALFAFLASTSRSGSASRVRIGDFVLGLIPGLLAFTLTQVAIRWEIDPRVVLPLAGIACLAVAGRPARFSLGIAGLVLVGFNLPVESGKVIFRERTFFGIHRIYQDGDHHWLAHGTTVHGGESRENPGVPLTYYHREGPAGTLFSAFHGDGGSTGGARIAAVGLGTGSLMAYAVQGEHWDLFELDPTVARIAEDPAYFTFLQSSRAEYEIILGDARLSLERREEAYDMIVVDAFSSDAIPVHLLTLEAVRLYQSRLRAGGWIAFHTSNRYADFSSVLATVATEAGMIAFEGTDDLGDSQAGRYPSRWVLFAEEDSSRRSDLLMTADPRWQQLPAGRGRIWTDGYSSILEVLRSTD